MGALTGKRALVTAAGSGIGRCVALRLVREGAAVFGCDVASDGLNALPATIGRTLCDVSKEEQVTPLFEQALDRLGGLDILVNVAGIAGPVGPVEDSDPADWRHCIDVNLVGTYLCTRIALPELKQAGGGSVINFSSTSGLFGYPHRSPYCAAKWAVIGFTKSVAAEAGPHGVRVNAICPGAVTGARMDRVITAEAAARGVDENAVRDRYTAGNSLRTWVAPEDLADMVVFLASEAGRKITGQAITIDGQTEMA